MNKRTPGLIVLEIALVLLALLFLFPLFLMVINSFKTLGEVLRDVLALPKSPSFANFAFVWKYVRYPRLFLNNLIITVIGIAGIVIFSSIAAYMQSRHKSRFSTFLYFFCVMPMLIPFQTIMITVLKLMSSLKLTGSTWGLGIQYWGFGIPLAVFIYHGFVKMIPREIDESAMVDGATTLRTFFQVIFPLLRPVSTTIIVIDVMWIWNDFLLPLLMVNSSKETQTLTLAAYGFIGQYNTDWQYAMAAMVMAVMPSIIFFVIMQKDIVKGVVVGAVKA